MNSKKIVSILTSAATIAMTMGAAFMPAAPVLAQAPLPFVSSTSVAPTTRTAQAFAMSGNFAYIATIPTSLFSLANNSDIQLWNVTNPYAPTYVSTIATCVPGSSVITEKACAVTQMKVVGDTLIVAYAGFANASLPAPIPGGVMAIDINSPGNPIVRAAVDGVGAASTGVSDLDVLYIGSDQYIVTSHFTINHQGTHLWKYNPNTYALEFQSTLATAGYARTTKFVAGTQYAIQMSGGTPLTGINFRTLQLNLGSPATLSVVNTSSPYILPTGYFQFTSALGDQNLMFVTTYNTTLDDAVYVFDVSDPLNPVFTGSVTIPDTAANDKMLAGKSIIGLPGGRAIVGSGNAGSTGTLTGVMYVINASNPSAPFVEAQSAPGPLVLAGSGVIDWNRQLIFVPDAGRTASTTGHPHLVVYSLTAATPTPTTTPPPPVCDNNLLTSWSLGAATNAYAAAVDNANGYVYVAKQNPNAIGKYQLDGTFVTDLVRTTAGNYNGLGVDAQSNVYVGGSSGDLEKFNSAGVSQGSVAPAPARDVVQHPEGAFLVASGANVVAYDFNWNSLGTIFTAPSPIGGIALDPSGNYLYVTLITAGQVVKYSLEGVQLAVVGGLSQPFDVAVNSAGDVYVALGTGWTALKYDSNLTSPPLATYSFSVPNVRGVAVDASNNIYIVAGTAGVADWQVYKYGCSPTTPTPTPSPTPTPPTGDYKDILTFSLQVIGQGAATFAGIEGAQLRVYNVDDTAFKAAYGTSFAAYKTKLADIYASDTALVTWCETDGDGACTAFKTAPGNYLVIGQYVDGEQDKTVYISKNELSSDFNADKENFADLKIQKKYKQGAFDGYGPGGQVVVVIGTPVASSNAGGTLAILVLVLAAGLGLGAYLIPKMRK